MKTEEMTTAELKAEAVAMGNLLADVKRLSRAEVLALLDVEVEATQTELEGVLVDAEAELKDDAPDEVVPQDAHIDDDIFDEGK